MRLFQYTTLILFSLTSACSQLPSKHENSSNVTLHVQINDQSNTKINALGNWSLQSEIEKIEFKPKIYFYNFMLTSKTEPFIIEDIDYKYGQYGKWRVIEKKKYLTHSAMQRSAHINAFPITIKRNGTPHNQLLRLTVKTKTNKQQYINLVFGVQKCLAKREKEFVCF